jgi:hypothetical protein
MQARRAHPRLQFARQGLTVLKPIADRSQCQCLDFAHTSASPRPIASASVSMLLAG